MYDNKGHPRGQTKARATVEATHYFLKKKSKRNPRVEREGERGQTRADAAAEATVAVADN